MPQQFSAPPSEGGALLVDYQTAAALLGGVSTMTVRRLVDAGSLQRVRLGRRAFVTRASLVGLVADRAAASSAAA